MRSVVLDFKDRIYSLRFKIQFKPHKIAYRDCSGTFSLDVRLMPNYGWLS